jgi:hypothetical protein
MHESTVRRRMMSGVDTTHALDTKILGHQNMISPSSIAIILSDGKTCKKYFHMYSVDHNTWDSYATIHFVGIVALWLQNVEAE